MTRLVLRRVETNFCLADLLTPFLSREPGDEASLPTYPVLIACQGRTAKIYRVRRHYLIAREARDEN